MSEVKITEAMRLEMLVEAAFIYARDFLERTAQSLDIPLTDDDGKPRANFYLVDDIEKAIKELKDG